MIPKSVIIALSVLMLFAGLMTPQMFGGIVATLALLP